MNITEFLTITSAIVPERTATIFEGHHQTYGEFQERSLRLADALAKMGVGRGDRVATIHVNCPQHIEAYFATAMLDAIYVPMNFRVKKLKVKNLMNFICYQILLIKRCFLSTEKEF